MTNPSVRFVMEQARVTTRRAVDLMDRPEVRSSPSTAVWVAKREKYVELRHGNRKPHIYLAQYPSSNAYWRVCGSKNRSLNIEANLACNELNQKRHGHSFD